MTADNQLRQLQLLELEALSDLKKVCEQENITFFLRGGSVMGAVKYKGFIPWDDDMDIAVPRSDYNRLIEILKNRNWSEKFWCASYRNGDKIHSYFPRILVKEEILKNEKLPRNNALGLTIIDILPLDGAPETRIGQKIYYFKINFLRALAAVWTFDVKDTINMKSKGKTFIVSTLYKLNVHKLYTQNQIYDVLDRVYSKISWKESKYSGTITGSLYSKEILPTSWWGEGIDVNFETESFKIPTNYDEYLKQLYGENYMTTLPSEKDRKSHLARKD